MALGGRLKAMYEGTDIVLIWCQRKSKWSFSSSPKRSWPSAEPPSSSLMVSRPIFLNKQKHIVNPANSTMAMPLPASHTKHLELLFHPLPQDPSVILPLKQISSSGSTSIGTTGTTLWLSAQVLSSYLSSLPSSMPEKALRVIELGAGIGYTSLVLASLGYQVTSTDIEPVFSSVLAPNLETGKDRLVRSRLPCNVYARKLDWTDISRLQQGEKSVKELEWVAEGWDMVVMTDTFYAPQILEPLWDTLIYLSSNSKSPPSPPKEEKEKEKRPPIYIALEARDPVFISRALEIGRQKGFELKKIAVRRVARDVERWGWSREDWEGIDVWKGRWKG